MVAARNGRGLGSHQHSVWTDARRADRLFARPIFFAGRRQPVALLGAAQHTVARSQHDCARKLQFPAFFADVLRNRWLQKSRQDVSVLLNSMQIVHAQGRFSIASVLFDDERPGLTLPEKYLK